MLQLRQCKLAFPSVHLMVGVCSDELVRRYKASPVLTSAERYESVRHCKWVDEVVEDAPWCVDAEFFARHRIDYVAHDEEPYAMVGSDDDVYSYAKSIGESTCPCASSLTRAQAPSSRPSAPTASRRPSCCNASSKGTVKGTTCCHAPVDGD